jgi:glycosyltransferase involved in cell wall biosynthesis
MSHRAAEDGTDGEPLVTVVIPTWNRAALVETAVRSVLAQTCPRLEVVVVDDGSTDGTAARLRAIGDARVTVLECGRLAHVGRLRNLGARAGSGALVAFLDSDDVWLPGKLAAQVDALRRSGAAWCYTDYHLMDPAGGFVPRRAGKFVALDGRIARDVVEIRADLSISSLVVRRAAFEAVGGFSEDPALTARGDWELYLRLATHADAVAVPQVLTRMLEHDGRTTHALAHPYERTALAYGAYLRTRPPRDLRRAAHRVLGGLLAQAAAARLARREPAAAAALFARALGHRPRPEAWVRALAAGLLSALRPRA